METTLAEEAAAKELEKQFDDAMNILSKLVHLRNDRKLDDTAALEELATKASTVLGAIMMHRTTYGK